MVNLQIVHWYEVQSNINCTFVFTVCIPIWNGLVMDYSDRGIDVVRGSNRRYFSIHLSLVSSVMLDQEVPLSDAQCIIVKFLIDEGVKTV